MEIFKRFHKDLATLKAHQWKYWFDNYIGCAHGCLYCLYGKGNYSNVKARKKNDVTIEVLRRELRRVKNVAKSIIYLGATTDIYQPIEAKEGFTRTILKVFLEEKMPIFLTTKSSMILRDVDILQELSCNGLVEVSVTASSLDESLIRKIELATSAPKERFALAEKLVEKRIPVSFHVSPLIPGHMDKIVKKDFVSKINDTGAIGFYCCLLGIRKAYRLAFMKAVGDFDPNLYGHLDRVYGEGKSGDKAISPLSLVVFKEMEELSSCCKDVGCGFFCEHIPFLDSGSREGGIFRYKLPTTGDLYRRFFENKTERILLAGLMELLKEYPAVDEEYILLVQREWRAGRLFDDTLYHPFFQSGSVGGYSLKDEINLKVSEVMTCD